LFCQNKSPYFRNSSGFPGPGFAPLFQACKTHHLFLHIKTIIAHAKVQQNKTALEGLKGNSLLSIVKGIRNSPVQAI
jgi:hypothetical protein